MDEKSLRLYVAGAVQTVYSTSSRPGLLRLALRTNASARSLREIIQYYTMRINFQ